MAQVIENYRSFDTETFLFRPGEMAPTLVCGSVARVSEDGKIVGELLPTPEDAEHTFAELIAKYVLVLANGSYDFAVLMERNPGLRHPIFKALREGRVHDILPAEALHAIYYGHLGKNPDHSDLRTSSGKVSKRYSLEIVTRLVLGRDDAKLNDAWRTSYALLLGIPVEHWPATASTYPVDDSRNTLEVGVAQKFGRAEHAWAEVPAIGGGALTACKRCGEIFPSNTRCEKNTEGGHKNISNLPAQVRAAFALHLGSAWGLRTDPVRVEKLAAEVEEKHRRAVERFQKKGWIRQDGSEDQIAVKKAVALAYGATGKCGRCGGTGQVVKYKTIECRGEKLKGRYQGCLGAGCVICKGARAFDREDGLKTCKNVFNDRGEVVEPGCDGTGLDLSTAPMLPRSDKLGVKTDRDASMESGDEDLADFGENEFEKSRSTYVPYLRKGIYAPLPYQSNVLVATGRVSYEGSPLHQMPRQGGERGCIRARGAWCGSPIEYVLGSTDYEAGELVTLSQLCYWLFGYSRMREVINAHGKPGILHSDLAAEVLGISLEEFLIRLKSKDKQAGDFRQAAKWTNFGKPGGMGIPKMILTNRKKNAGFTECETGPARMTKFDGSIVSGFWGIRYCILITGAQYCGTEKITEWKGYPCAPICKACANVCENILGPSYFKRYPEIKDYFAWASKNVKEGRPAPSVVWNAEKQVPEIIRERGGCDYPAFCNNGFQSMLADIGKHAFYTATEECYLGVKADGTESPLAGSRLPIYLHDEPLSELILDKAHVAGPRIAEIMVESGELFAPDVTWKAETALSFYWEKAMEPVYQNGILVPWGTIPDEHRARFAA